MSIYLYFNAGLYLLFAGWCTIAPGSTAGNLGFTTLTAGGKSEYLVIYGGLQLGLAVTFGLLGRDPAYWKLGMAVSIALYAPIVVYRAVTILRFWPVPSLTLATAGLETLLLVAAIVIYGRR